MKLKVDKNVEKHLIFCWKKYSFLFKKKINILQDFDEKTYQFQDKKR